MSLIHILASFVLAHAALTPAIGATGAAVWRCVLPAAQVSQAAQAPPAQTEEPTRPTPEQEPPRVPNPPPAEPQPPAQTPGKPPEPSSLQPLDLTPGRDEIVSGTAFNPAMSVVPDLLYYADSRHGDSLGFLRQADGFQALHAGETGDGHGTGVVPGFNLRELEVAFSAAVDPYFDATAIVAVSRDGVGLEEAFARTRSLPAGLQIKVGKFLSDIGYLNRQHPHQWDFVNRSLAHELILGDEGLNEVGMQATWLPALPVYLLLGAEALQGENESISNYLGADDSHPSFTRAAGPRLFTGFAKFAPDLGFNHALQLGGSVLQSRLHQEEHDDGSLEGSTWTVGVDAVYKFDSPGAFGEGDLTVLGEYLRRVRNLSEVGQPGGGTSTDRREEQDGLIVQLTYGFAPRWTASLRADVVGLTNRAETAGSLVDEFGGSRRVSASVAFHPTHFSRLRFQVERASVAVDGARQVFTQAYVQLQLSLGVHGAHRF